MLPHVRGLRSLQMTWFMHYLVLIDFPNNLLDLDIPNIIILASLLQFHGNVATPISIKIRKRRKNLLLSLELVEI